MRGPLENGSIAILLDDLVPGWRSSYTSKRIEAIDAATTEWWHAYATQHFTHTRKPVRLLIVAEAPPFTPSSQPITYVYKPDDSQYTGGLLPALLGGVQAHTSALSAPAFKQSDAAAKSATLDFLGEHGVLLCDPLPIAMRYSGATDGPICHGNLRGKSAYEQLCVLGWQRVIERLEALGIELHPQCTVAFSLRKSARALLTHHEGKLPLPNGRHAVVDEERHCFASASGYPNAKILSSVLAREPLPVVTGASQTPMGSAKLPAKSGAGPEPTARGEQGGGKRKSRVDMLSHAEGQLHSKMERPGVSARSASDARRERAARRGMRLGQH